MIIEKNNETIHHLKVLGLYEPNDLPLELKNALHLKFKERKIPVFTKDSQEIELTAEQIDAVYKILALYFHPDKLSRTNKKYNCDISGEEAFKNIDISCLYIKSRLRPGLPAPAPAQNPLSPSDLKWPSTINIYDYSQGMPKKHNHNSNFLFLRLLSGQHLMLKFHFSSDDTTFLPLYVYTALINTAAAYNPELKGYFSSFFLNSFHKRNPEHHVLITESTQDEENIITPFIPMSALQDYRGDFPIRWISKGKVINVDGTPLKYQELAMDAIGGYIILDFAGMAKIPTLTYQESLNDKQRKILDEAYTSERQPAYLDDFKAFFSEISKPLRRQLSGMNTADYWTSLHKEQQAFVIIAFSDPKLNLRPTLEQFIRLSINNEQLKLGSSSQNSLFLEQELTPEYDKLTSRQKAYLPKDMIIQEAIEQLKKPVEKIWGELDESIRKLVIENFNALHANPNPISQTSELLDNRKSQFLSKLNVAISALQKDLKSKYTFFADSKMNALIALSEFKNSPDTSDSANYNELCARFMERVKTTPVLVKLWETAGLVKEAKANMQSESFGIGISKK